MILIVASNKDTASLNIKQQILNQYPFKETSTNFQQNPIYTTELTGKNVVLVTLSQESVTAKTYRTVFLMLK